MDTAMTRYLGIDGGGTHTRAVVADDTGAILASAAGESINPRHVSQTLLGERLTSLVHALDVERHPVGAAFLALGGVSTAADSAEVVAVAKRVPALAACQVTVDNDATAGLTGGLAGQPGIVLIAGTGAACLGIAPDGRRRWCGGWEALADDAGSAYWIAVEAIRCAVRQEDGRLPRSPLHALVFSRWPLTEPRALAERLMRPETDRATIASMAPGVLALTSTDPQAADIVTRAVAHLAELVAVTARDAFGDAPCDLIYTGGLANSGPPFTPQLTARIAEVSPAVRVVAPELPPVLGAVLEAMKMLGHTPSASCLERLRSQRLSIP
jgi:N-acetylglucosamine kinase-like BadF-type ATPase